jgi:hypothetical protein
MSHLRSRLLPLLTGVLLLLALLVAPSALAQRSGHQAKARVAKKSDRNRDRIPDRWERRHGLSLKVNQARRDQDRDGLRNRAEFLAGTDPRDDDSDNDGVEDGEENAGTVKSFDGTTLVIRLFSGEEISATVDPSTEVECHDASQVDGAATAAKGARIASSGDDAPGADEPGDDHGDDGSADDESGDDHGDDDGEDCGAGALQEGVAVHEAELAPTADGNVWREVKLIVKAA